MRYLVVFAFLLGFLAGCDGSADEAPTSAEPTTDSSTDPFDLSVRPQDDFYQYVNGPWLASTEIPPDFSSYGAMTEVFERTEAEVRSVIERAASSDATADSDAQKIGTLYTDYLDVEAIDSRGVAPLAEEFAAVEAIDSYAALIRYFGEAMVRGIDGPVAFYVDAHAEEPTRSLAYLWQDGLGLPDRDYYLSDDEKFVEIRQLYVAHINRMLSLGGVPAAGAGERILKLETALAEAQWTRVENRNRQLIYGNRVDREARAEFSPGFDWAAFLAAAEIGDPELVVFAQTSYLQKLGELIRGRSLEDWRDYANFRVLTSFAPFLNREIDAANFEFYGRTLRGQESQAERWKRGTRFVNGSVGELVGKLYVAEYFPPEYKQKVGVMVENLRAAFGQAIDSLEWMSAETRTAARAKLAAFNVKIGYPDRWRDYSSLTVQAGDLLGNVIRSRAFEYRRQVAKLSKPVDRGEWNLTPQTVNAYYRPTFNEIVFPAAILQAPFFNAAADDAYNYGGIGSVIGHEFSHGFDDQGRKFDGEGRLRDWWTEADAREYESRAAELVAQYSAFQPLPDLAINGELTLGENIGDLAGLIVAHRAYELSLKGLPAPRIDGLSGQQRFFVGFARAWRGKIRDERLREQLLRGPHSPARYRVMGILPNIPGFYSAFDLQRGDAMYLPPEDRVKIW